MHGDKIFLLAKISAYTRIITCTCIHHSREDSVIFSKRQGYQVTMKKVAQLQDKIEGMEVSVYHARGVLRGWSTPISSGTTASSVVQ